MNKIFKVIWSKSKQCYIVVSEIAKNKTGKKKIIVASILAALAMVNGGYAALAADPPSRTLADASQALGTNGLAIGSAAKSRSNQSVAIGYSSDAFASSSTPENPATAVGAGAKAIGAGTAAYGLSAYATADYATAIGFNAKASQENAVALGSSATAAALNSIAMGKSASITAPTAGTTLGGQDSIAMGNGASANQHSSISVGLGASSNGVRSIAIGPKAFATDEDSIAIGTGGAGADKNNQAFGNNGGSVTQQLNGISGVQLYYGAKSTGKQSIAMGYVANAKDSGIAIGNYAVSDVGGGTAMGKSVLSRNGGIVVGQSSNAIGINSVAYGNTVNATNVNSVALGNRSTASDQNAVAVGYNNNATGKESVAVGNGNQASNENAVSIGASNSVTANNAVAIGRASNASGLLSTAIGNGAFSKGVYDVAIGSDVTANGNNSVAIGRNAKTSNASSLAIGVFGNKGTSATGDYSIAMGRDVTASAESAIAIGKDAVADKKNAVAFGSGSTTSSSATAQSSTTIGGKTYSWNKGVLSGADLAGMQVSVGKTGFERQIKNVAAGEISANSTDAINGAQLYSVASGLAKDLKVPYVSIKSGAIGAGSNFDNDGATGSNSIAIGPFTTATKDNGVAIGNGAKSLSEDSIVIGRNAQAETKPGAGLTTTSRAIAIGSYSRVAADVTQGIAIGSGIKADEGAVVTGDQSIAIGGNVKVEGHAAIAIGGDDARKAGSMPVTYTNTNNAEVTGTLQSAIQNLTGYNLSNYKGTAAGHAGVAYGTSALAGNAGVAIGTASDSMTRKNDKGQVVDNKPVTNAVAIGTGARANFDNSVAIGGGSNTDHYATKQVNAIIDGVEVKWSGGDNIAPGDVVSFGAKGFERQLKNVAPGEVSQTSTDAVNGSQIYSLARKVTNIMNGGSGSVVNVNAVGEPLSKVVTGTGSSKVEKYYRTVDVKDDGSLKPGAVAQTPTSLSLVNIDQTDVNQQTKVPRTLGNVANGVKDNDAVNVSQLNAAKVKYFSVNSTEAGNKNNDGATGTDAIAIGPSAISNDVGSVALGKDAKANGAFTVALGGGNWQFKGAQANGVGTTALGSSTKTKVGTNYQTAIGFGATTEAESALALGYNASASAQNAIALGKGASTAGQGALAFGVNSQANGESALAMGFGAQANSGYAVSLGYQANNSATNNANGVSIGWAAGMQSNGSSNVGIGTGAGRQISGNNNVSIGNGAGSITGNNVYTSESIMLGSNARVVNSSNSQSITNVIAVGNGASGGASSAIALGQGASSTNQNSIAIGTNASVSSYNGVAIGAFSVADTKGGIIDGYNANTSRTDKYAGLTGIALKSSTGAVSIGNGTMTRQIVNLAAGTADTDAVNVAQLKSVNLAFKGNTGTGDVNLAANPLTIKGNDNYLTTNASGNSITISTNQKDIHVVSGIANADSGVADAKNVATAINNAIQSNAYKWRLTANGEATPEIISKDDTVDFSGDTNISVARNGKKITTSLKKDITVDTVKANKSVTIGTGSNQITLDGNSGAVTGRTFSGNSFAAGNNVLNNTTLQIGSPTGANNVSITTDGLTAKAGAKTVKFGTSGIDAGGQQITNVSSGGNVGTNAANITDLNNAVAGVTLNLDTNSKTGSVNLKSDTLKITGANGIRTDLIGTGNRNLVIGLDQNTVKATTNGIGLSGDSGTVLRKYLKDDNADFKVSGDGGLVSTSGTTTGVQVSVDKAKVKDLAVEAVTVSKANATDNPITVTPTAGTNSKDYAIGIDTTKLAAKTDVTYRANSAADANAKKVSLSKGFNFVDGGSTVATVDNDGKVSFDLNTATKNQINTNTTDIATNKSNIAMNTADIATNKGKIATNTTNIAANATNIAHTIVLADDAGASTTAKSLKDGNVSFNIKGDNKFISTAASGNDVTLTVNEQAIKDTAKAASSFKVKANTHAEEEVKGGDTIAFNNGDNIEISQTGKTFTIGTAKNITVDSVTAGNTVINTNGLTNGTTAITGTGITTDTVTVGGLSIDKTAGINAGGKVISNVASGGTTDSNAANIGDVKQAVANLSQNLNITDGTNNGTVDLKNQKLNVAGANGVTATVNNQTITVGLDANIVNATTKGIGLTGDTGSTGNKYLKDGDISFAVTGDGSLVSTSATTAGVKVAVNSASITAGTDGTITGPTTDGVATAKNVADAINAAKKASKTEITANTGEAANATTGNVTLTSTTAADGHTIYDVKLNDKVMLGSGANAVTIDGTAGKATIGSSIVDGVNNTFTTGGASPVTLNGATGTITGTTANIGGVTVNGTVNDITGLSNTTVTAADFATKGRAATEEQLKAATGATTLKFTGDVATNTGSVNLNDDTFGIKGDGKYISTDVNGKNVNLTVSEAEVKKSAVAAVTVSTDTTDANNPLTVTPTTSADGTTKDYKVTIDGTKIANKTNLSYKANNGTAKQVSLADGLDFTNGTLTTASIDNKGVVKYDVNTAAITAGTDGTITGPTTDGVATAKNVADAINAAKKASKTEITANTGEATNATTGNVTLTSTTATDGHTIYDVKLNNKVTLGSAANAVTIDGTTGKATIGSSIIDGVNNTFTTGGTSPVRLNGATGTITGKAANIGGVTVDGTNNHVTGLANTTWNGTATTGRAATEDQLKAVADAAGSQTWEITADKKSGTSGAQTGTKENAKVGKDDKVSLIAGENLTVEQAGKNFTYSLNTDLVKMNSATFEATGGKTTVIKGDSIVQTDGANVNTSNATSNTITDGTNTSTITAGKATIGTVGIDGIASKITTGGANAVVINGVDGTVKTGTVTVTGGTTNDITGLSNTTVTAADFATKGRAATEEQLKAATGATTLKFTGDVATNTGSVNLKDDTFGIKGDGKYISTDVNGKNVNLTVSEAEVKKSAVAAVTVSTDTTDANNPLTVTPTTSADGTTKDYKVTIDGTKIANKTNLSYKANNGTAKQVSLADGLDFTNGTLTTASIDNKGVVKYDVNTATITAGADGTITGPTTDGVATAKNVTDAINAAKKASKTEITANTGEATNATTGNVTLTSTTAADGHTIYDVKLNDKVTLGSGANAVTIDGTAGKATIGSSVIDGVNNTLTTGGAKAVTLNGATGTITGTTANIGGVTVNGTTNDITGLSNTTVTGADFATKGRAATEEQLKAVGEQTWQITADKDAATSGAQTGTKKDAKVGKDDKVQLIAGENLTVNQNERDFTYSLNKDLVKMNSAAFLGTGTNTTVITGDSITQTAGTQTNTSTAGGNTVADGTKSTETTAAGQVIKDGAKTNTSTVDSNVIDDGNGNKNTSNATSNTITDGTNTSTITAGKATIGTVGIDGIASKITTGGANAVVINGVDGTVKTGTVTVTGGTTNDITGLSNTTVTAADFATKGRAATEEQLKAATGATTLKFTGDVATNTGSVNLKDDTFGIKGDGKYISTDVNGKNVNLTVSEAEVKKSAVAAVTVSTDTTDANNPLTVTPTTSADGTTKDYKVTIDGTKIANKTNLSYKANNGTAKQVSLADGLDFTNGTLTTASIDNKGVVKYDVNTAAITAGTDGTITGPTTDGVATAKNVADAINAAKKASKTEITANTGEATNATTGNVTLTSTTATDGHTIYDVKLNNKVTLGSAANAVTIDGTTGKATIGSSIIDGVNNTFTTGGASPVTLNGATGTITGKAANIGGVTVNGTVNDITGLSNTTVTAADFATKGRAATEEQLKAVGEQTWQITADKDTATSGAQTGTKKDAKVGKDDKVQLIAGENMTVNQNERDFTFTLNKDLVKMNSATFEATGGKTTVIKGDSIVQTDGTKVNTSNATSNTITDGTNTSTITAGKATIGTVGIDGIASKITTGGANAVVINGVDGTVKTGTVTVTGGTTNDITGLSNTTVTAADFATKGRAATEEQLKAATGATTLKFTGDVATNTGSVNLKDDTFGIKGDGKYISTDVNGKNVNLTVSEAEVKKSAVAAVTVSTDTTDANNPLTVTPTTSADGTTKDYKVTIDGTKIANKTNLSYKANNGTAKQVSLADGLDFTNGTLTTASIDNKGVVKYDVNTATITAGADGTITGPTTDGVATAKNVTDAINAAKKASKTEITANTGEATNATTGNVTLTSTTAADGHTIYDVKLNDKVTLGSGANAVTIDGTTGKATIGSSIVDGVNNTFTTGGTSPVTLNGATGTITGTTANIGGVTVNGTTNDITGLSNTTVTGADFATKGRAATEEQLKAVGEQTWQITADKDAATSGAQTGTKKNAKVGKDDKVQLIAGENLTVNQNERDFTFTLNKDLVKMNSATFLGTGTNTTVITGDSITQTAGTQTNTSTAGGNTVADGTKSTETTAAGQVIKDGAKTNTSTVDSNVIDDGNGNKNTSNATSNTITDGTNTSTITAGRATIGSSIVDGVNNTFTTGGTSPVTLNGATGTITGTTANIGGVTVNGTTNDITGLSNTTVTGADFATKGRAATEEQLKAVGEQTWQITADKDAATSGAQTGTKKNAKVGKDDKVQLIAGENLTVNQNERDFTFTLNKDLVKMNSATFLGTGTNTTVITGDSITQTAGTQTNTSTAGGNTVADGTKSTETTAAGQVIKDGAKTNTSTVDSNVIDDGNGNKNTSNATSNTITDGTNTSTITAGRATIGSSIVDGVNNTFTTGGTSPVTLNGATGTITGTTANIGGVTVNGTTNDITGLSNTTVTGADFATKGRAATEEQLKAVGEQTWQITADKDTATSGAQTGTKKDAKVGKDDKVQLIAGENLTVNQNERDFTYSLNKDLVKMNSAAFLGTGTNTTVITGDSITQTAGTQTNTSTAGGNTVADGTKSTETTAAGQVIKDGAKTNTSTVDSNVIDDGNGNKNTSNATSNTITDGTNTSTITAGRATIGSSIVDGVNNTFTTGGTSPVTLNGATGTITGTTANIGGVTVNGTTNDITGLSNTTVTGADFATKGRAATEEQLKAVGEQTWQITADKDTATSGAQTGTKKDAKVGKDDKVQLIAGENLTVNQNERDFTYSLNKDLVKMNSAAFLGTGTNTTVITGDSITQTAGTQTNTSTAGGNTVADGTKSTETTAAGQVIKDGAKSNKSSADGNTITDGTNTSTVTAGKANIGNIAVDGVNNKITMGNGANPVTLDGANGHLDGLTNTTWVPGVTKATTGRAVTEDQLQQVSDAVGAGWKVNTGTVTGSSGVSNGAISTKVSSGEEVKLQAGDNLVIDQNGKTVSYSLNKDLTKMNSATFEATGGKTTVIKGDSIVQTDGGKTNTATATSNTLVDNAGNSNVSNATSNTLKNAAGDENKVDPNGATVKDAAGNNATFTKDGITITKTGKDTVSLTSNGLDNGKNKIVNVAAGKADTDAVNVSQLKEYAAKSTTELTANNGEVAGNTKGNIVLTKTTAADGHTIYDNKLNDKITLGAADPTKAITVDGTAGTIKAGKDGNAVAINGTNGTVKAGDGTNAVAIDGVNGSVAVADKITLNGKDGKAGIGTVGIDGKDGIITTGGTNSVKVDGSTGTVTGLTNKTWTPGSIVSGRAATEDQLKEAVADSGWKATIGTDGSGQSHVVGTSPEKIKAEETVTFKAGNNMVVTQDGKSISYAVNPELTDMKSATFKDAAGNTTVTNGNGMTITPGSANPTNPNAGPVLLTKDGLNNGNNQIKGVAPGTNPTDAVNVGQLNASNASTSQAINQVAAEVQRVGAHAAAMAALKPIQYDPLEPTQVMAGVGNYRGETAAALGLAHYTNENTMFNVGVSVGGNHNMVNAGVTHKFGYSPEKKNIPDRYKAGPISSVYVMQDEVSSLKKENAEQKYVIADQAARLTTLEAENEQQRRELAETKKGLDDLKAAVDKLLASKG